MKCEHERWCENCVNFMTTKYNCNSCESKDNFTCKFCKENKPLTISQLEQMNGLPVYVTVHNTLTTKEGLYLINVDEKKVFDNCGEWICFENIKNGAKWGYRAYKEKPSPRMVTLEMAIKENLQVRYHESMPFMNPIESIVTSYSQTKNVLNEWLKEPIWEVKEG